MVNEPIDIAFQNSSQNMSQKTIQLSFRDRQPTKTRKIPFSRNSGKKNHFAGRQTTNLRLFQTELIWVVSFLVVAHYKRNLLRCWFCPIIPIPPSSSSSSNNVPISEIQSDPMIKARLLWQLTPRLAFAVFLPPTTGRWGTKENMKIKSLPNREGPAASLWSRGFRKVLVESRLECVKQSPNHTGKVDLYAAVIVAL